jgi:quercetin dioxygenase-like cupin family protein
MFGKGSVEGYNKIMDGIRIKTLVHGAETLMTEFVMDKGALLIEHSHPHEQTGYLVKGKINLFIAGKSRQLNPGDSWSVPSGVKHKAEILEDSLAIEVFSPCRDEYIRFENAADIYE